MVAVGKELLNGSVQDANTSIQAIHRSFPGGLPQSEIGDFPGKPPVNTYLVLAQPGRGSGGVYPGPVCLCFTVLARGG